jgi:flagellar biosynthesis/type III secretory pathway ATPase
VSFDDLAEAVMPRLRVPPPMRTGTLARVVGLTLEAKGIMAPLGAVCEVVGAGGHRIEAEVVGFQDQAIFLMPFVEPKGVGPGDLVRVTEHTAHARLREARRLMACPSPTAKTGSPCLAFPSTQWSVAPFMKRLMWVCVP